MNFVGVMHLYGTSKWNGIVFRHKCVTLKKGSWYGDYQILTHVTSDWELVAGGDHEFDISKKPKGMKSDHILCYQISKELFTSIIDEYPQ